MAPTEMFAARSNRPRVDGRDDLTEHRAATINRQFDAAVHRTAIAQIRLDGLGGTCSAK